MDLPLAQLDSLKFKANQILESIVALQRTIEGGGLPAISPWPDILSKYNIILSQTHNFSNSLLAQQLNVGQGGSISATNTMPSTSTVGSSIGAPRTNAFERIALYPCIPMPDAQLDNDLIPLLRNQQTTEVLRLENESVRRLAERMTSRGSLGVLGITPSGSQTHTTNASQRGKVEYEDVLQECAQIRDEHDRRVERAVRAVAMLRDKYDWKQRVEVEVEEPEELDWDPRVSAQASMQQPGDDSQIDVDIDGDAEGENDGDASMNGQSSDEDEVEGELVHLPVKGGSEPATPAMPTTALGEADSVPMNDG